MSNLLFSAFMSRVVLCVCFGCCGSSKEVCLASLLEKKKISLVIYRPKEAYGPQFNYG